MKPTRTNSKNERLIELEKMREEQIERVKYGLSLVGWSAVLLGAWIGAIWFACLING